MGDKTFVHQGQLTAPPLDEIVISRSALGAPGNPQEGLGNPPGRSRLEHRHPPRVSREKQIKVAAAPRAVREIAWKAQMRLCGRFRSLTRKGKRPTVVAAAIARELSAFIWAINREVMAIGVT